MVQTIRWYSPKVLVPLDTCWYCLRNVKNGSERLRNSTNGWFGVTVTPNNRRGRSHPWCERWLVWPSHRIFNSVSPEKAVNRLLQMYASLQNYFKSESELQAQFQRLVDTFDKPITEVYLLFYQSVLPMFTHLNLFFQREDPNIYLIMTSIRRFLQKLLSKFLRVQVIKDATDITMTISSLILKST